MVEDREITRHCESFVSNGRFYPQHSRQKYLPAWGFQCQEHHGYSKNDLSDSEGSAFPDYDFQLIDIGDTAIGHPVFDLAMLMNVYINMPSDMGGGLTEERVRHLLGFEIKYARKLWNVMCGAYFALSELGEI